MKITLELKVSVLLSWLHFWSLNQIKYSADHTIQLYCLKGRERKNPNKPTKLKIPKYFKLQTLSKKEADGCISSWDLLLWNCCRGKTSRTEAGSPALLIFLRKPVQLPKPMESWQVCACWLTRKAPKGAAECLVVVRLKEGCCDSSCHQWLVRELLESQHGMGWKGP